MDKKQFDQLIEQVSGQKNEHKKTSSHELYARGWDRIFGPPIDTTIEEAAPLEIDR